MTLFPTPEQEARSIREGLELMLRGREARITLLETLIRAYADLIVGREGVTYLEECFFDPGGLFTREKWAEIRRIVGETD